MPPADTYWKAAHDGDDAPVVSPELLRIWVAGRALARATSPPRPIADGWCVHADLPQERYRYVFPAPCQVLGQLAQSIRKPHILLKVCAPASSVAHLLPPRWRVQRPGYLMETALEASKDVTALDGYELLVEHEGALLSVIVTAADGTPAASGHAALLEGHAIFDRIETQEAHRRLGLGSRVVQALGRAARDRGAHHGVLVSTPDGRALYTRLGWRLHAPFTTARIPADKGERQ